MVLGLSSKPRAAASRKHTNLLHLAVSWFALQAGRPRSG